MGPEIYRERIRLSTSPFFLERVARKDGLENPIKVPFEKISYVVTAELEDTLGFDAQIYKVALPLYVAKAELEGVDSYRVYLEMEDKRRDVVTPNMEIPTGLPETFPHMTIGVTRVYKDGVEEQVGEQSFELLFYNQEYPSYCNKQRPRFSIFRRRLSKQMTVIKSAIWLGFKNGDQNTHCMALILKKDHFNTRFVYTHDGEVNYSKTQAKLDDMFNGNATDIPSNILDPRIYDRLI